MSRIPINLVPSLVAAETSDPATRPPIMMAHPHRLRERPPGFLATQRLPRSVAGRSPAGPTDRAGKGRGGRPCAGVRTRSGRRALRPAPGRPWKASRTTRTGAEVPTDRWESSRPWSLLGKTMPRRLRPRKCRPHPRRARLARTVATPRGGVIKGAAVLDCFHANGAAPLPNPHATPPHFVSSSTIRMRQVFNFGGRGGLLHPGFPRSKSLVAFDKKFSGALQIFPLIRTAPGRAGGVGPDVTGRTAGPVVPDWAFRAGIRRAGAERTCGVRRLHRDRPASRRPSQTASPFPDLTGRLPVRTSPAGP
jgi:hypothetical protein